MLLDKCPICESSLEIRKLMCSECGISYEGDFYTPPLARLSADEQMFVELFVLSSGSLKEMAEIYGITYPTLRVRLNEVIEKLKVQLKIKAEFKKALLDKVGRGEIEAEKAARIIKSL